jgi:hypothetical protein
MLRSMSGEEKRIAQTTPRFSSTLQHEPVKVVNATISGHFRDVYDRDYRLPNEVRGTRE